MSEQLARAAEGIFEKIPGATIEHRDGLLVCTASPDQIDAAIQNDPWLAALEKVIKEMYLKPMPRSECDCLYHQFIRRIL